MMKSEQLVGKVSKWINEQVLVGDDVKVRIVATRSNGNSVLDLECEVKK